MNIYTTPIALQRSGASFFHVIRLVSSNASPTIQKVSCNGQLVVTTTYNGVQTIQTYTDLKKSALSLKCDANTLVYLSGIVTYLECYNNQLTTLDVSKNTALTYLDCADNQLTTLDVSKNTALTYLDCAYNQLTTLDVSKNTALTDLECAYNQLTTLDVSKNTALTYLDCAYNQLTTLDVSKNTALTYLDCADNQLTTLDVSKNTALTDLECYNNQLTTLDVSKNTALTYLECADNQLIKNISIPTILSTDNSIPDKIVTLITDATSTTGQLNVYGDKEEIITEVQDIINTATKKGWTVNYFES